jgi:hypothetical protein
MPEFVPVVPARHSRFDNCPFEVQLAIQQLGGSAQFGWKIWLWPSVLFEAIPHCVWRMPSGTLKDVTPNQDQELRILFVPDDSVYFDEYPQLPERFAINQSLAVQCYLAAADAESASFVRLSCLSSPGTPIVDANHYRLATKTGQTLAELKCFLSTPG